MHVVVFSFLATVGIAFMFPNASAGAFSIFNEHLGLIGALYGFLQMFSATLMSYVISLLQLNSVAKKPINSFLSCGRGLGIFRLI